METVGNGNEAYLLLRSIQLLVESNHLLPVFLPRHLEHGHSDDMRRRHCCVCPSDLSAFFVLEDLELKLELSTNLCGGSNSYYIFSRLQGQQPLYTRLFSSPFTVR